MPVSASAFTISGLSLVGVPLTVGFTSKWYLILAALDRDWWWAVAALIASSLLALVYVGRMLRAIWMEEPPTHQGKAVAASMAPWAVVVPMSILALANVYFFFNADPLVYLANAAAEAVMGGR